MSLKAKLFRKLTLLVLFVQLFAIFYLMALMPLYSKKLKQQSSLTAGSSSIALQKSTVVEGRYPASYSFQDDIVISPPKVEKSYYEYLFGMDNENIERIRQTYRTWEEQDEYARNWGLEDTGLYNTPSQQARRDYVMDGLLDHVKRQVRDPLKEDLDTWWDQKRASWEESLFSSDEDLEALNTKQLASKASASSSNAQKEASSASEQKDHYELKVKPRLLRGRFHVRFINPFVETDAVISANGRNEISLRKNFEDIRLHAFINYEVTQGEYVAEIRKQFLDNVSAQIRSHGGRGIASQGVIRLMYHKRF